VTESTTQSLCLPTLKSYSCSWDIVIHTCSKMHGLKLSKHLIQISTARKDTDKLMLLAGNSCPYCHLCPFETLTNALTEYWQCEHAGVDLLCNRLRALLEEQKNKNTCLCPTVDIPCSKSHNVSELKQKFKTWRGQAAPSNKANAVSTFQNE